MKPETEMEGLDVKEHGEPAYDPELIGILKASGERPPTTNRRNNAIANQNFQADEM